MATQVKDYRLVIDEKDVKAETYFPGITLDDFDRAGNLSPWRVCRMFEAGRIVPFYLGNFLEINNIRSDKYGIFLMGGDYYFDRCLWEMPPRHQYFPYKVSVQLIHYGKTSLTIRQILVNTLDGKKLAEFCGKLVYVNRRQKRSQPWPEWHQGKYRDVAASKKVKLDNTLLRVPEEALEVKTTVAASDTNNGHTNQASYVRFCLDAAESTRRCKKLRHFTKDTCQYPILKMSTSFRGETYAGDVVSTYVWEDGGSTFKLHFIIMKEDQIVFLSTITFENDKHSKL